MEFEINVAYKGKHFFATHPRSATCYREAIEIYKEISSRFKESEGYEISVSEWQSVGQDITKEIKAKVDEDCME